MQLAIQPVDRIRWPSEPFYIYTEDRFVNAEIHTRHRFIPAAQKFKKRPGGLLNLRRLALVCGR